MTWNRLQRGCFSSRGAVPQLASSESGRSKGQLTLGAISPQSCLPPCPLPGYLSSIKSVQPPQRWKILVVDSYTQSLLNAVFKLNDILQQNVSTVENIEHNRQPQPSFEACYILTPTSANVDRIVKDLTQAQGRPPQYAAGHVFFVDGECRLSAEESCLSKNMPRSLYVLRPPRHDSRPIFRVVRAIAA